MSYGGFCDGTRASAKARRRAWWYNPRNRAAEKIGTLANQGTREFVPHVHGGFGTDNVLVLDDASRGYAAPGTAATL